MVKIMKQPTDKMLLAKYDELIAKREYYIECNYSDLSESLEYIDKKIDRFINKLVEYGKLHLIQ